MDFGAASSNVRTKLLPVIGVRKRAVFANEGGTTVTRPFYRRIVVAFFMEKLDRGVERR
ncbi:tryptophan synthase subunit beta [Lysinibacillus sp. KCTC 33748]|nr:tryptophan synthase subunit beta [Lysinibacillus sp. KCTC 33748]